MLNFPFWMARLADQPNGSGLQPLAFSSPRKLAGYLDSQNVQHWQLHLVTRYSALTYLTELQLAGHAIIRINADNDGSGGTTVEISDAIAGLTS
jgi:hypothetical protein